MMSAFEGVVALTLNNRILHLMTYQNDVNRSELQKIFFQSIMLLLFVSLRGSLPAIYTRNTFILNY